jgi:hypothetical protein
MAETTRTLFDAGVFRDARGTTLHNWRFQFSIKTVLLLVLSCAIGFGWIRLLWNLPFRVEYQLSMMDLCYPGFLGFWSLVCLFAAAIKVVFTSNYRSAWIDVILAWMIVAMNVAYGVMQSFATLGPPTLRGIAEAVQYGIVIATIGATTIPILLSVPIVVSLLMNPSNANRISSRWPRLALTFALINVVFLVAFLWLVMSDWASAASYLEIF